MNPQTLKQAQREVAQARQQLASTMGTLQYKLKPGNLMNDAWDGVREKSGELADGAVQAVKDRPLATSGIVAGIALFLAREPLWRAVSSALWGEEPPDDRDIIHADLEHHDIEYDLTAPSVPRSAKEGVNA